MPSASRPSVQIMGILNVTPDSFSGDGLLVGKDYVAHAVAQARQMIDDGATMLDIGGESTRPGHTPVAVDEEIRRTAPVIAALRDFTDIPLAIDTVKAAVAEAALAAGATIINDISALAHDPEMAAVAVRYQARVILMHNQSRLDAVSTDAKIGTHYDAPVYRNVVNDVARDLLMAAEAAMQHGVARAKIILDPGIGFGKSVADNLTLIAHLDQITGLGFPVLMGVSRKSFIGLTLDMPVDDRLEGTAACVTACVLQGAEIMRVHDVKFMARVAKMAQAIRDA